MKTFGKFDNKTIVYFRMVFILWLICAIYYFVYENSEFNFETKNYHYITQDFTAFDAFMLATSGIKVMHFYLLKLPLAIKLFGITYSIYIYANVHFSQVKSIKCFNINI